MKIEAVGKAKLDKDEESAREFLWEVVIILF